MSTPESEYREFAGSCAASLHRTAYLLCGDWHLADDLVQETLVQTFRHWRRVQRADNRNAYVKRAPGAERVQSALATLWRTARQRRQRPPRGRRPRHLPEVVNRADLLCALFNPPAPAAGHRRPSLPLRG